MSSKKKKSAAELAEEGALKREQKQAEYEKNQSELEIKHASYRQISDQRRVFKHITRWYSARLFFLWLGLLSLISVLPFLMLNTMVDGEYQWMAEGFIWFFTIPIICFTALFFISLRQTKKKVLQEKKWLDDLPFKLHAYPDLFVYRSYPGFRFTFEFKRKTPDAQFLLNVLSTLPFKVTPELEYEDVSSESFEVPDIPPPISFAEESEDAEIDLSRKVKTFRFELDHPTASKFNAHRRWARHWIILACENQFQAIHEEYPINGIILGEGHTELNFDWWKPLKKFL